MKRRVQLDQNQAMIEIELEGGAILFSGVTENVAYLYVLTADSNFSAADFPSEPFSRVKYVLREGLEGIVQLIKNRGCESSGKLIARDHHVKLRAHSSGRLQVYDDDAEGSVKPNATPTASATSSGARTEAPTRGFATETGRADQNQSEKTTVRTEPGPIRILVVDDSVTMRRLIKKALESASDIEIVGESGQPKEVAGLIRKLKPDLMTLDIHMPDMNGVELLESLSPDLRIPTLVVSSLSMEEGSLVIKALELGALDYLKKPARNEIASFSEELLKRVHVVQHRKPPVKKALKSSKLLRDVRGVDTNKVIAIGASTGGTEAIREVITHWPKEVPPIVITQHMPPYFSKAFADRLNELCAFEVREAKDGDELRPGLALVAPGGFQMSVKKVGGVFKAVVRDGDLVSGHKPSVDHLFRSVAEVIGARAVGVILTGMGRDGADGLLKIREAGGRTLGQDEASCVVYGMPKAAYLAGAVEKQLDLHEMAEAILGVVVGKVAA